jgi:ubiquitin-activating enzyme E1
MMNQNVTILINQPVSTVQMVNRYTRETNSKLVVLYMNGLGGVVFVDAGTNHVVTDSSGENIEPVQIGSISPSGLVQCAPNSKHDFQTGDIVRFTNLEGTNLIQFEKEWKVKVISTTSFQLVDNIIDDFTFVNGTCIHIKKPVTVSHKTFAEQTFVEQSNRSIAFTFDMVYANDMIDTFVNHYSENVNVPKLPKLARTFDYELMPLVSLFGSFGAMEAIKLVTNKYMPCNQWFTWCDQTLVPDELEEDDCKTPYGKLYGINFELKLNSSEWLMVGSGAIGCEHLKNLAYMGVTKIHLTDPDVIEKSNLNRQFLFRSHHIGQPKSKVATDVIQDMKPNMNITAYTEKVGSDNMEYTNKLLPRMTGVLNALDNIKARRFMDEQCFTFGLPLFESGTTGTKGNTQPVIPFVTETYSASSDPENEKSFPMCTIKSFPNEIAHTIHWAMDQFEFFNRAPSTMNRWATNSDYIKELSSIEKSVALSDINLFTVKYNTSSDITKCAEWAVDMFTDNYCNNIKQLLTTFPHDHEVTEGVKFWSGGKRCPKPIEFDINNTTHMDYIEATTILLARVSGYSREITRDEIKNMIQSYVPKEIEKVTEESEPAIGSPDMFKPTFVAQEFEKDDDTNYHISWVTAASNLRAMNYSITMADRQQTKGVAGRIIPAISTTTSAVSGLILLEMMKYLMGIKDVTKYRSTFINMADPLLVYSDPIVAGTIEVAGVKMNSWTKFEYKVDSTLEEFKKYYEDMFKVQISMIVIGTSMIYADFIENDMTKLLSQLICETMECETVPSNVTFTLAAENDVDIPAISIML